VAAPRSPNLQVVLADFAASQHPVQSAAIQTLPDSAQAIQIHLFSFSIHYQSLSSKNLWLSPLESSVCLIYLGNANAFQDYRISSECDFKFKSF
jgi:hypothetical protein